jgi:hypothetical protein
MSITPELSIQDIVKNHQTRFSFPRVGNAYCTVVVNGTTDRYPVELAGLGGHLSLPK